MGFASITPGASATDNVGGFRAVRSASALAAIVLLAVGAQIYLGVNTDTSWNITLVEKMLGGERPYVDFIEINPPSSFLLCLAPTLAARLTGATPEFMLDLFCFASSGASIALCAIILTRGGVVAWAAGVWPIALAAAVLLLLPARAFGQREHIAAMASLPCLAALVVWAARGRVEPALSVLAGLGAGIALSIKPHFALFFLPILVYLAKRAGWRALSVRAEFHVALTVVALYWVAVVVWFPAFFDRAAPMAREIYLPVRRPLAALLFDPTLALWITLCALLALAARKRLAEPLVAVPALASLGAMAAYLAQGKLWPYQGYPAIAYVALALGPPVLECMAGRRDARVPPWPALASVAAVALTLAGAWLASGADKPELERAVAAVAPHPKLIAIGSDLAIGHPLTRRVHGVWVGSTSGLWITDMTSAALDQGPVGEEAHGRYQDYLRFDRERLVSDILGKQPDAVLIANASWLAWAQSHPDVAAALAGYGLRETADNVMIYARLGLAKR